MGEKLPTLKRRDAEAFFEQFAHEHRRDGNSVVGKGREGSFTVHLTHKQELRSDVLQKALSYLGVSRDEFAKWMKGR